MPTARATIGNPPNAMRSVASEKQVRRHGEQSRTERQTEQGTGGSWGDRGKPGAEARPR